MTATTNNLDVESISVKAVVHRADGTLKEDLGEISSYKRPWYRTLKVKFLRLIGKA